MSSDITQQASVIGTICEQGPAGKTPIKGVDYWTEADKDEIVQEAMPHPDWNENDSNSKNYIKNRPGGYTNPECTIEWDGNSEGKVSYDMGEIGIYENTKLVKVSDTLISTKDQIVGKTLVIKTLGKNPEVSLPNPEVTIEEKDVAVKEINGSNVIMYVTDLDDDDVLILIASFPAPMSELGIPESGTYFFSGDALNETFYISSLSVGATINKIPLDLVDMSEIKGNLSDIYSSIDTLVTSTNAAKSTAEEADSTANSALETANSALATANAASSSIDNKADVGQVEMLQSDYDQFRHDISDEIDHKYDELGLRIDNISAEVTKVQSTANSALQRANTLTDDYINNLIDTKLGVIENGTY